VRGFLLVNPRSGSGVPTADELAQAARERGVEPHLLRPGEDVAELARGADADVLGVAGGDGSLAPVASVAIERDLPFVCVPFGTRNHFARDLGLDRHDPVAALDAFVSGRERRVDVGRAGERAFLNNVSLGLYARLVHRRERHRRRRELLARTRALLILLQRPHPIRVAVDGERITARIVLVANNHYQLDLFSIGERTELDEGRLFLYAANGLFPGAWEERSALRFELDAQGPVRAAIDGEPDVLDTPIEFRIEPGALRVLVPGAATSGAQEE
jgi:diacylglycerol kinase family enzyme